MYFWERGVKSGGSMNSVMFGKNFGRAINCHKVMAKSLERLLFDRYLETTWSKSLPDNLLQAINHLIKELQKT